MSIKCYGTSDDNSRLRPCPWCEDGGRPVLYGYQKTIVSTIIWSVRCDVCSCDGPSGEIGMEENILAWNTQFEHGNRTMKQCRELAAEAQFERYFKRWCLFKIQNPESKEPPPEVPMFLSEEQAESIRKKVLSKYEQGAQ